MRDSRRTAILSQVILVIASLIALYPFLSILRLALSEPGNFAKAWSGGLFSSSLLASLVVAVCVVVGAVVLSVLAGYAFACFRFPGRTVLMAVLLIGLVMPYEATIIPLYYQMKNWGLLNTYWALILPQIGLSMAFGTFWMRTVFRSTPTSLREASFIDGASPFRTLRSVLLPIALPAVLTLATLLFLFTWNEFLLALVLVPDNPDVQTAPLSLSFFAGNRRNVQPGVTAAAAVIVAVPILVAYIAMQRRFIRGIIAGAVKE